MDDVRDVNPTLEISTSVCGGKLAIGPAIALGKSKQQINSSPSPHVNIN